MNNMADKFLGTTPDLFSESTGANGKQKRSTKSFAVWFREWKMENGVQINNQNIKSGDVTLAFGDAFDVFMALANMNDVDWSAKAVNAVLNVEATGYLYNERIELKTKLGYQPEVSQAWKQPLTELFPNQQELAVAAFSQILWQIKRKIFDMPVYDHLFVVVEGLKHGTGKSELMKSLGRSLGSFFFENAKGDIFTDIRFAEIFTRNFVILLDEMAKMSKADGESVKGMITADKILSRKMGTTFVSEQTNLATLIGTTNHPLREIIRSTDGMRRFCELNIASPNDLKQRLELIRSIDWVSAFRSIDEQADSPYSLARTLFEGHQEDLRSHSTLETWILDNGFEPKGDEGDWYTASAVLARYNAWLKDVGLGKLVISSNREFMATIRRTTKLETKKRENGQCIRLTNFHKESSSMCTIQNAMDTKLTVVEGGLK